MYPSSGQKTLSGFETGTGKGDFEEDEEKEEDEEGEGEGEDFLEGGLGSDERVEGRLCLGDGGRPGDFLERGFAFDARVDPLPRVE